MAGMQRCVYTRCAIGVLCNLVTDFGSRNVPSLLPLVKKGKSPKMTIEELAARLKHYDQKLEVQIMVNREECETLPIANVEEGISSEAREVLFIMIN